MYPIPRSFAVAAGLFAAAILSLTAALPVRGADATPAPTPSEAVENSVVKVFSTVRYPDLPRPWTKQAPREISGSGVVIDGNRILTNAHVVLYASQIQVQANQSGDKVSASVESIAPGIDLAVLKLDDESFFKTHPALKRADALPQIKDAVMVYGFPEGGTTLSITKGIVSRIEFVPYHYMVSGLRIQIDAAINPGNSGGPAVVDDKMIGLSFSRLGGGAENIGYIIPCEEIERFLKDVADGHYDGKPAMYDEFQTLQNPALREYLKLDPSMHGVVVHHPFEDGPDYPLKEWDVVTKIGTTPVDDEGKFNANDNLRLRFTYLVQNLAKDGKVPLTIIRNGKELQVEEPVAPGYPRLIPPLEGDYPSYFIYGPMVFSNATEEFVNMLTGNPRNGATVNTLLSLMGNPLVTRRGDRPTFKGEQLVIVPSPFFPHQLVKGYAVPTARVVKSVNGIAIKSLDQLVAVLRDCKDQYITIAFDGRDVESLVFPRKEMVAATDGVLSDNGIRSQGTPDTMAIWNAKPEK